LRGGEDAERGKGVNSIEKKKGKPEKTFKAFLREMTIRKVLRGKGKRLEKAYLQGGEETWATKRGNFSRGRYSQHKGGV